jgi:hypothetical protein
VTADIIFVAPLLAFNWLEAVAIAGSALLVALLRGPTVRCARCAAIIYGRARFCNQCGRAV